MTEQTETTADALKQPTIIVDRAQAEIDRLRELVEESYYEGVHAGEHNGNWWDSIARMKRDGLASPGSPTAEGWPERSAEEAATNQKARELLASIERTKSILERMMAERQEPKP